jgi:hypothetical protein
MKVTLLLLVLVPAQSSQPSFEKLANQEEWKWDDEAASLFYCVSKELNDYHVILDCPKNRMGLADAISMRVLDDSGKHIFTLKGHQRTVFARSGDLLFVAVFPQLAASCVVKAYDFKKNKMLWESDIEPRILEWPSIYSNKVNISVVNDLNGEALRICGKEPFYRYIEYLDIKTGTTLGRSRR